MQDKHFPKVSVVVPVYNGAATIEDCIESLFRVRYPPDRLEIVIVDNHSQDDTPHLLARYRDRARVFRHEKRGAAAARNRGIREARGDVIAFTDADCVVDPNWLRNLVSPLTAQDVGIVGGRILARPPANVIERFGEKIHDQRSAIHGFRLPYVVTMNWASPRSVLFEVGLFDEAFIRAQDVDLSLRIFLSGHRLVYAEDAVVFHRNESTYSGLFREGFTHGFHSARTRKVHEAVYREAGCRRADLRVYKDLLRCLVAAARGEEEGSSSRFVFNLGKRVGKLCGSVCHGYLVL